jgi:UPF0755 protein
MSKLKIVIPIVLIILIVFATSVGRQIFGQVEIPNAKNEFKVEQGQTVKEITTTLVDQGLIKSDFWFRTQVWLKGQQSQFLAGTFDLPEKINTADLIKLLTTSATQETKTIKILEGWGIRDIAIYFENQGMFQQEEITELVGLETVDNSLNKDFYISLAGDYPILNEKRANKSAEGFLFPDTYEIFIDATLEDIVGKMVATLDKKVSNELLIEILKQEKSFYDILIMASIIEAEVPDVEDRAIVSDIFWSRLESGVALQSDATLNYAISGDSPSLTYEQLKIDSPYNSYLYRGLPPTPIGNPGINAIEAAVYPADTDYFYFLSTPEGETIFSRTLDEHNTAKNRYLR